MNAEKVFHIIEPEFDADSRVLILGTIPSPKSRETGFYYGHPQNRFWKVLSAILNCTVPQSNDEKREFLHKNHIALWDVLASCMIENAADTSIREPKANDMNIIFREADIRGVFATGKKAYDLYNRLCPEAKNHPAVCLPSTSPANCRFSLEELIRYYSCIKEFL